MSLERSDAIRIAKALAAKMSAEPEKYAKIIAAIPELDDSASCGSMFGPTPAPDDATKALAAMHEAVNGEDSTNTGHGISSKGVRGPCALHHSCNGIMEYNAVICGNSGDYYLCSCNSEAGYSGAGICITPDIYICPNGFTCQASDGPFKCERVKHFSCTGPFSCTGAYWQWDRSCPSGENFNCAKFTCEGIDVTPYSCVHFGCQSVYGCEGEKECLATGFGCPATLKFNCPSSFTCDQFSGCGEDRFECGQQHPGGFDCTEGAGYSHP